MIMLSNLRQVDFRCIITEVNEAALSVPFCAVCRLGHLQMEGKT